MNPIATLTLRSSLGLVLLTALTVACSDGESTGGGDTDLAGDAAADTGSDTLPDADTTPGDGGGDLIVDAPADSGADPDLPDDTTTDQGDAVNDVNDVNDVELGDVSDGDAADQGDAAADAPSGDVDPDAADAGDTGSTWNGLPAFDWDFCPGADTYVGDEEWDWSLEVTENALFCKMFEDVEWACCEGPIEPIIPFTQPERWNERFEMRVVPGTYAVPESEDELPIRVPVCIQFADGRQGVTSMTVMGSATGRTITEGREVRIEQPLVIDDDAWTTTLHIFAESRDPLVLDDTQSFYNFSSLEEDEGDGYFGAQSCTHVNAWRDLTTTLTLGDDRGELVLHTRIGQSPASTEPGVFYQAEGELDGVAWSQSDRWHLWYEVQHHHFVQYYLVLFSQNIGDVCGLEVLNAVLYEGDLNEDLVVYEVACDGLDPPAFPLGEAIEVTDYSVVNENAEE